MSETTKASASIGFETAASRPPREENLANEDKPFCADGRAHQVNSATLT
jgi:hypothetical protein